MVASIVGRWSLRLALRCAVACISLVISAGAWAADGRASSPRISAASVTSFVTGVPAPSGEVHGAQVVKLDSAGDALDAHSDFVAHFGAFYYLYGESYGCAYSFIAPNFCGFNVYRSRDLVHWTSMGKIINPATSAFARSTCGAISCWGPDVVYNPRAHLYVLWFYRAIGAATTSPLVVMESHSPLGPWENPTYPDVPTGFAQHVYVAADGSGYLAWGSPGSGINVQRLNASYTDVVGQPVVVTRPGGTIGSPQCTGNATATDFEDETPVLLAAWKACGLTEAPSLFSHGSTYYLTFSDPICGFCLGTETGYFTAPTPMGPWTGQNGSPSYLPSDPGVFDAYDLTDDSCGGQPFHVSELPVGGGGVIDLYTSALWENSQNNAAANHYWQPLQFQDGLIEPVQCSASVEIPLARPVVSRPPPPPALEVCAAGSGNSLNQTFVAARTGEIRSVAISLYQRTNPARVFGPEGLASDPLQLNLTDLSTGAQASMSLSPAEVPWAPTRTTLPLSLAVQGGDRLQLSLSSTSPQGCYYTLYLAHADVERGGLSGVGQVQQLATGDSALLFTANESDGTGPSFNTTRVLGDWAMSPR